MDRRVLLPGFAVFLQNAQPVSIRPTISSPCRLTRRSTWTSRMRGCARAVGRRLPWYVGRLN